MATYTTEQIRNIALVGTTAAGKTTLCEAMLAAAGVIGRAGTVEAGNTVSDWVFRVLSRLTTLQFSFSLLLSINNVCYISDR